MRTPLMILTLSTLLGACGNGRSDFVPADLLRPDGGVQPNLERLQEVADMHAQYNDLGLLASQLVEDARGCVVPQYQNTLFYVYNVLEAQLYFAGQADTIPAMGVHVQDVTYDITQVLDERPRIYLYNLDEQGHYELAGLEWYFEPQDQNPLADVPVLFDVPMLGVMEGHIPGQGFHYDMHAWPYGFTDLDRNLYGYFGENNFAMPPPDWYLEYEPTAFALFFTFVLPGPYFVNPTAQAAYSPVDADGDGAPASPGDCVSAAEGDIGYRYLNNSPGAAEDDLIDPFAPEYLLYDGNGLAIGYEWSVPKSVMPSAPTLFQQSFYEDETGENWVLRVWWATRSGLAGIFEPAPLTFSCQEPAIPIECLGG